VKLDGSEFLYEAGVVDVVVVIDDVVAKDAHHGIDVVVGQSFTKRRQRRTQSRSTHLQSVDQLNDIHFPSEGSKSSSSSFELVSS